MTIAHSYVLWPIKGNVGPATVYIINSTVKLSNFHDLDRDGEVYMYVSEQTCRSLSVEKST